MQPVSIVCSCSTSGRMVEKEADVVAGAREFEFGAAPAGSTGVDVLCQSSDVGAGLLEEPQVLINVLNDCGAYGAGRRSMTPCRNRSDASNGSKGAWSS